MQSSDEIRNLLATYCERIDRGDFAGVGDLFREGGLAERRFFVDLAGDLSLHLRPEFIP